MLVLFSSWAGLASEARADDVEGLREAAARVAGHPRLFLMPGQQDGLREIMDRDPVGARLGKTVVADAEALMDEAPVVRELEGRRMLRVSRTALDRISALSMAWHLTGDRRFVKRAEMEMRAVAAFADWNPSHFLDVAEMTLAVAVGYDWLHAELDEGARDLARRAIMEKGLRPALAAEHWWLTTTNNWNQVCNGGLVAGALVVLEHEPETALRVIGRAIRALPVAMAEYAPSGAYPEGPAYWAYGTTYNVILLAALESALGTTFGLDEAAGFERTAEFPQLMTGPSGLMFNFSDGRPDRGFQPAIYWLARRYSQPGWAGNEDRLLMENLGERLAVGGRSAVFALLWREPVTEAAPQDLARHWTSDNSVPVSVHRECWDRADAVFFGIKAGSPIASHGQMDIGSFVLDANGRRWAHDLGAENYHRVESHGIRLWSKAQDGERWKVFRNNNLSHNTLVIDGEMQRAAADALIVRFSDDPDFPHSVVDMSASYAGQVKSAYRGMAMTPGGAVVVRDSLAGLRPGAEVRWGMATRAKAGESGGPVMILEQDGEKLEMTIHGPDGVAWGQTDLTVPPNEWDSPNVGVTMVHFTATAPPSGKLDLAVVIRPANRAKVEIPPRALAHPLEWSGRLP